jgi:hypothetical protein
VVTIIYPHFQYPYALMLESTSNPEVPRIALPRFTFV